MKIAGDTHTHTLLCQHAYSTLLENIQAAAAAVRLLPAWRLFGHHGARSRHAGSPP